MDKVYDTTIRDGPIDERYMTQNYSEIKNLLKDNARSPNLPFL